MGVVWITPTILWIMPVSAIDTDISTLVTVLTARAKLPDNLQYPEFVGLAAALNTVVASTVEGTLKFLEEVDPSREVPLSHDLPEIVVLKVQYGSDFTVVLGISAVAGAVGALGGAFVAVSKALDLLASAGLKNEQRLEKKENRLERRAQRDAARRKADGIISRRNENRSLRPIEFDADSIPEAVLAEEFTVILRNGFPPVRVTKQESLAIASALSELAEYGIQIGVETPE